MTSKRCSDGNGTPAQEHGLLNPSGKENGPVGIMLHRAEDTDPSIVWSDTKVQHATLRTPRIVSASDEEGEDIANVGTGNMETLSPAESVSPMTEPSQVYPLGQHSVGAKSAAVPDAESEEDETQSTLGSWIEPHPRQRKKKREPCGRVPPTPSFLNDEGVDPLLIE